MSWTVTRETLGAGWHTLRGTWDGGTGRAALTCDGRTLATAARLVVQDAPRKNLPRVVEWTLFGNPTLSNGKDNL